jgi:hypothetical protein
VPPCTPGLTMISPIGAGHNFGDFIGRPFSSMPSANNTKRETTIAVVILVTEDTMQGPAHVGGLL